MSNEINENKNACSCSQSDVLAGWLNIQAFSHWTFDLVASALISSIMHPLGEPFICLIVLNGQAEIVLVAFLHSVEDLIEH